MIGSNVGQMLKGADHEQRSAKLMALEEVLRMLQSPMTRSEIKAEVIAKIESLGES